MAISRQPPAVNFPPSPPPTEKHSSAGSDSDEASTDDLAPSSDTIAKVYPLPPEIKSKSVLREDLKTPDAHVERDPRLIRLTGLHPFNTEAPLSDLYNEGFLTSENLHYVRSHGAVPRCEDADQLDWTFTIDGLVEKPITMSVRDLVSNYEQSTYPITLVCAGNRRKEQNVVRKSKGFSWGPAGVSTALWTGVPLMDLLKGARPTRKARYVCFEGADKLPNGYYGTSVKLNWCMDPNRGLLIAHKMNGTQLHPDHGKPVRIVIPGQIGGRSVKWLKKITVTAEPSENWYHIYDNRVLPTNVSPEASADLPEVWKDEKYAIYDLNVNSATCLPAHDETLSISQPPADYNVQGYAYGGGGRRVTRVEITLDRGKTWKLADIRYPEDDYRDAPDGDILYGGKVDMWWREACFCWCFWSLNIATDELKDASDMMVRAMDESMMVQPREMYWSVLGMMNNPWFRIVIHREDGQLRFEHPTQPALMPGGWMERVKKAGGNLMNGFWGENVGGGAQEPVEQEPEKEVCLTNPKVDRKITIKELREHSEEIEPWFVVRGEVYDGTDYLDDHPGGPVSIFGAAGQDATDEFMAIHSENAKAMLANYHIGTLDEQGRAILSQGDTSAAEEDTSRAVFLHPKRWFKSQLHKKVAISSDTKIFSFKLDHPDQVIGLPVGQHLMVRLRDPKTGEVIIRPYTPLSDGADKGTLDVLIKIYYDSEGRKGGKMTQALDRLPLTDPEPSFVEFKGPVGKFEYLGQGKCTALGRSRNIRRFVMICAGSGITPIFQVLRAVMRETDGDTHCLVLDGNRTEQDILCRAQLDELTAPNAHRCRILYTLSNPTASWKGGMGRMDRALFEQEVGSPSDFKGEQMALICGPEPMEEAVQKTLNGMGWAEDDMLVF